MAFMHGKQIGLVEAGKDFFANDFHLRCRLQRTPTQICQHHDKLVTAYTRDNVHTRNGVAFALTGNQALRGLLQQRIPHDIAEGVVNDLEIIQIDEQ